MATDGPDPTPCDPDIFERGLVAFVTHSISSNRMELLVKAIREVSDDPRTDWHFVAGRAVVQTLANVQAVQEAFEQLKPLHDALRRNSCHRVAASDVGVNESDVGVNESAAVLAKPPRRVLLPCTTDYPDGSHAARPDCEYGLITCTPQVQREILYRIRSFRLRVEADDELKQCSYSHNYLAPFEAYSAALRDFFDTETEEAGETEDAAWIDSLMDDDYAAVPSATVLPAESRVDLASCTMTLQTGLTDLGEENRRKIFLFWTFTPATVYGCSGETRIISEDDILDLIGPVSPTEA